MANPLEQAINSGIRANDLVGSLFARIGTSEHPRGFVTSAYRSARRALKSAISEPQTLLAVDDVMLELRRSVASSARVLLLDAQGLGREEAARQMAFYGVKTDPRELGLTPALVANVDAIEAAINGQHLTIRALLLSGADAEQIVGSDERAGMLQSGSLTASTAALTAALLWSSFGGWATGNGQRTDWNKQVVAALDGKTTDCCLKAHAQIQPMNGRFHLTGTPRYADYMDWPAFHWWCRTSGVLYLPEFDMGLTERMRAGARQIMSERASGGTGDRSPADAYG